MTAPIWILLVVDLMLLVLLAAVPIHELHISEFTLRARLKGRARQKTDIYRALHKNQTELKIARLIGLTVSASSMLVLLAWGVTPLALALLYGLAILASVALLRRLAFVEMISKTVFTKFADKLVPILRVSAPALRVFDDRKSSSYLPPTSRDEFTDQLQRLPSTVLSPLQRQRLENVLKAEESTVKDIMTPKKRVVTVEPSATLGPIVLSDLQKSGHRYFPVLKKKAQPEGVLNLSDISDLAEAKKHQKVKDVMQPQFAVIAEDTALYKLAEAFLYEKEYIIFVINSKEEFSGLVTIADFMRQALSIVTEDRS